MINFSMSVYSFIFIVLLAISSAMIVGCIWYSKPSNKFYISEDLEVLYFVIMIILTSIVFFMLVIGAFGIDKVRYESTDYDIESMINDLRSDGYEVVEINDNGNYIIDQYRPFKGKEVYYWHHDEKAQKYLLNK